MATPLTPDIDITPTPSSLGVCNCCGVEDATGVIKHVRFGWFDRKRQSGGTAVALCRQCRAMAAQALVKSLL